jgi:ABC-type transport system involved in cytochrome c biogenesis permease component
MTFLPIVARELRVAARRRKTYLTRVAIAAVAVAVAGILLPTLADQFTRAQGKTLFWTLSTVAFGYCLLAGAHSTADCLSSEKREGTIGLLFLTDLKGYDVVLGKLVSCSLEGFYGLLAIVPVLAMAFLLGGVTLSELGRMALLFLNTLFFSASAGVFVSSLSRHDRRATFATTCIILLVAAGPYALGGAFAPAGTGWSPFDALNLVRPSPVYAFRLLQSGTVGPLLGTTDFYLSIASTHAIGWAYLVMASRIVPRVCRERPAGQRGLRWREIRDRWSYGRPEHRRAFRRRLLDRNAFYWLAARDRIKAYYVWIFIGALALIWCWSGWMLQSFIFEWDVSFWALFLLFMFFKVWLASEVSSRFVEDRASGAFELLLSSPLDLKEMAHGQSLALRRQFGRPILFALVLTLLLLLSALRAPHSGLSAGEVEFLFAALMISLLADLTALKWLSMWHALSTSQVNRAMTAACGRVLVLPDVLFLGCFGAFLLVRQALWPVSNDVDLWGIAGALWLGMGLLADFCFGVAARWSVLHQFRQLATERYSSRSPGLLPFLELVASLRRRWSRRALGIGETKPAWHGKRWLVATPILVAAVSIAGLVIWKHALRQEVQAKLAAIRAVGQPVTFGELQTWSASALPLSENAAVILQRATPYFWSFNQLPRTAPGPRRIEWPGPMAPCPAQTRDALTNFVARNQYAIDLLQKGAQLRQSHWDIDWHVIEPRYAPAMLFSRFRPAGEVLQFDGLLALEAHDTTRVIHDLDTLFGLSRALAQEPFWVALGERVQFLQAGLRLMERLLSHEALSDGQLLGLVAELREAQTATGGALSRAFVGERSLDIQDILFPNQTPGMPTPSGFQQVISEIVNSTARLLGVPERKALNYLTSMEGFMTLAPQIGNGQELMIWRGLHDAEERDGSLSHSSRLEWERYWREMLRRQTELVLRLRTAEAACEVERYRIANNGQLPSSLSALRPDYSSDSLSDGPNSMRWNSKAGNKRSLPSARFNLAIQMDYTRLKQGYLVHPPSAADAGGRPPVTQAKPSGRQGDEPLTFTVER